MPVSTPTPEGSALSLLVAALDALDREGEAVAAAYVSMAIDRIGKRVTPELAG